MARHGGLAGELAPRALRPRRRLAAKLPRLALHALGKLGRLAPGHGLDVCLRRQLPDRLTKVFSGAFDVMLQLFDVVRRRRGRLGTGVRGRRRVISRLLA